MATSKIDNTVKVKLEEGASMPEQAHSQDVGYDIKSISCEYDEKYDMYIYHTGIYVETDPEKGYNKSLYLFPRSSNSKKECYLANSVGIVDCDIYRGEIQARFKNRTSLDVMIHEAVCKRMFDELVKSNGDLQLSYDDVYEVLAPRFRSRAKALEFAPYDVGDKCAQLVFAAEQKPDFVLVETINEDTDRGDSGFGGSGK
jgi:dUTPase